MTTENQVPAGKLPGEEWRGVVPDLDGATVVVCVRDGEAWTYLWGPPEFGSPWEWWATEGKRRACTLEAWGLALHHQLVAAGLGGERVAPGPKMPAEDLVRAKRFAAQLCAGVGEVAGDDGTLLSRAVLHLTRELAAAIYDRDAAFASLVALAALDVRALLRALKAALPELRVSLTLAVTGEVVVGLCETPDRGPPRFWTSALEDVDYAKGAGSLAAEVAAEWAKFKAAGYRYEATPPPPAPTEEARCKCPPPSGMCGDGPDRCATCGLLVPGGGS